MNEKKIHIDLFSGIGGFALAVDRVFGDVEHIFCDNEPFAQEVLRKHWPEAPIYGDIRTLTADTEQYGCERDGKSTNGATALRTTSNTKSKEPETRRTSATIRSSYKRPFLLTGGFPCQPFSQAGRRRGEEDDRFLWPEMLRVIREFSPLWVIAENVRGLLTQGGGVVFERVCTDLEAAGYEVQPLIIPAVAVGAPHRRDRVWFVAHRASERPDNGEHNREGRHILRNQNGDASKDKSERSGWRRGTGETNTDAPDTTRKQTHATEQTRFHAEPARESWRENWLEVATRLCRVDDGLPRRMDRNPRLKALGNAIVPQVAEEIMRAIKNV